MSDRLMLDPGERLIWSGQPQPAPYALKKGGLTGLFGIPFFAFAVFWTSMASSFTSGEKGPPRYFWLWGVPFLGVGLGLVLSPLWHFVRAGRTTYTLTSRRAVIDTTGPLARRTSVPLDQIPFVELQPGGAGHVLFREVATASRHSFSTASTTKDGFIAIAEAERVERLLRETIAKLRSQGAAASPAP
jgi:hypothetical protein